MILIMILLLNIIQMFLKYENINLGLERTVLLIKFFQEHNHTRACAHNTQTLNPCIYYIYTLKVDRINASQGV